MKVTRLIRSDSGVYSRIDNPVEEGAMRSPVVKFSVVFLVAFIVAMAAVWVGAL